VAGLIANGGVLLFLWSQVTKLATDAATAALTTEIEGASTNTKQRIATLEEALQRDVASLRVRIDDVIQDAGTHRERVRATTTSVESLLIESKSLVTNVREELKRRQAELETATKVIADLQVAATGLAGEQGEKRLGILRQLASSLQEPTALNAIAGVSAVTTTLQASLSKLEARLDRGEFAHITCGTLFVGKDGGPRIAAGTNNNEVILEVINPLGRRVVPLGSSQKGFGALTISRADGTTAWQCLGGPDESSLMLLNARGMKIAELCSVAESPKLRLWPSSGTNVIANTPGLVLALSDAGRGVIEVTDPYSTRMFLRTSTAGEAGVVQIFDYGVVPPLVKELR
jgi:hypothetical protein